MLRKSGRQQATASNLTSRYRNLQGRTRADPPICMALPGGRAAIHAVQIRLICAVPRADATDWTRSV